jgi:inosine-uridine nucleoside N-ribohydrolase
MSSIRTHQRTARQAAAMLSATLGLLLIPALGSPDQAGPAKPLVIDTDMGVDDAVALALALQHPQLQLAAIVACDGASGQAAAVHDVERMLDEFNRQEVPVYASEAGVDLPAPTGRERVEDMLEGVLPETSTWVRLPFSSAAYRSVAGATTVLALGPLTQLAAALEADPELASSIDRVVIAGDPADHDSWNLARDPKAVKAVRKAGVRLQFVAARGAAPKPASWAHRGQPQSRATSIADAFLDRLLADSDSRSHYLETIGQLHDELAVLFVTDPDLFEASGSGDVFTPRKDLDPGSRLAETLSRGRQRKQRVVFTDRPLPTGMLQEDVRDRRDAIVAANGEDEWFSQLLLNELHEHLGAYSIVGVKMGLRAAELLNAPPHSMTIVSAAPATQPESCLNDGLLVGTGSTPGRGLFRQEPGANGTVAATFAYNRRRVTLRLKSSYSEQIRSRIGQLLAQYSLADAGYWDGVRTFGLDVWEGWHRLDLFDVTIEVLPPPRPGREQR